MNICITFHFIFILFTYKYNQIYNTILFTKQLQNKNVIKILQQTQKYMAYYRKDQLSIKTRKLLADELADIILIVQSIESFRLALAQVQFFNGIQLFRYLDKDQKGYLTPKDFALLVGGNAKKILHYAFGWFDISKVGEITRTQFLQFIFPHRNLELRQLITERMIKYCDLQVKTATLPFQLDLLRSLIQQIMEKQIKLIPVRRNLMQQQDYTIKAVMNCLDVDGRGWITTGDFYKFLKNFDVDVSPYSICEMLGVYDNDLNGKISIQQLQLLVEGLQRSDSSYREIVRNSDKKAKDKIRKSRCICYKKPVHQSAEKTKLKKKNDQQYKIYTAQKIFDKEQDREDIEIKPLKNKNQQKIQKQKNRLSNKKPTNEQKSAKKQRQLSNINKQQNLNGVETYSDLKNTFLVFEKQTQDIEKDLLKIQQQLEIKTQMQLLKQLQNAKIRRSLKERQRQIVRQKMQQIQRAKQQQQIRRLKELQTAHRIQLQRRRHGQVQLQRARVIKQQNQRLRHLQVIRARQIQLQRNLRIRDIEQLKLRQLQQNRIASLQNQKYLELKRAKQIQLEAAIFKNNLHRDTYITQVKAKEQKIPRFAQTQLDWKAEARLTALHDLQVNSNFSVTNNSLKQKQNDYYLRYSKYCNNLAMVADPLGIKQHIVETDKHLLRSRQIRDQIKRDRAYSLNRYTNVKSTEQKKSKQNTQNDQIIDRTPQQNRDVIDTINKRTEQTKLVWS